MAVAPPVSRALQLGLLGGAVFLMAFQMNAVAPLLPVLAGEFGTPAARVGLLILPFALPYGVVVLGYGPLSDRVGRRRVLGPCLGVLATALFGPRLSPTVGGLLALRVAAGLGAGGIMPVALAREWRWATSLPPRRWQA